VDHGERPCLATARGQVRFDAILDGQIAAVSVTKKDQPHICHVVIYKATRDVLKNIRIMSILHFFYFMQK